MKPSRLWFFLGILLLPLFLSGNATAQSKLTPAPAITTTNWLGLSSLSFDDVRHELAWSSHPLPDYYKQEYLPSGQNVDSYRQMMLVELVLNGSEVKTAVNAQVAMLKQRKATDPVVNFSIMENPKTGDVLLDFIMQGKTSSGELIMEWNGYRYMAFTAPTGKKGVLLLGLSRRAYGDEESISFLQNLKTYRNKAIADLAEFKIPAVLPKNR